MMKLTKKGQSLNLSSIPAIGFALGVGAVVVAILALVVTEVNNANADNSFTQVAGNGSTALLNLTSQLPLIGTIAGLVIVVGLVVAAFRLRG